MMAVRRRPRPEMPAFVYNAFNNSVVYGVLGISARRNVVK
jgi:hypothetical protein